MFDEHLLVIESTIKDAIRLRGDQYLAKLFFEKFFEKYPDTKNFFKSTDITTFGPKKIAYVSDFLINTVRFPDYAESQIITEVMRHQVYGLHDKEYYYVLFDAFHESVRECLSEQWNDDTEEVWGDIVLAVKSQVYEATKDYL